MPFAHASVANIAGFSAQQIDGVLASVGPLFAELANAPYSADAAAAAVLPLSFDTSASISVAGVILFESLLADPSWCQNNLRNRSDLDFEINLLTSVDGALYSVLDED
jgi:hypothetical protein